MPWTYSIEVLHEKLVKTVPANLKKLRDVVEKKIVEKDGLDELIKNVNSIAQ